MAVARLPVVVFVSTETALALSLPLAFVLAFPSCAPASLSCLVDGRCLQLCADAWSQFPAILGVGAVLGLVPATLGYAATRAHLRRRPGSETETPSDAVLHSALFALVGSVMLIAAFAFMGARMTTVLCGLSVAISQVVIATSLGLRWARRSRNPRSA